LFATRAYRADMDDVERDGADDWDEFREWLDAPEWMSPLDDDEGNRPGPTRAAEDQPTPGERLLYVLGQLYRLYHAGALNVHPQEVDVEEVARLIGVSSELEPLTSHDRLGTHYHFPSEVLYQDSTSEFPWHLMGIFEWAAFEEANAFWAES
jgi:hypothetical protein